MRPALDCAALHHLDFDARVVVCIKTVFTFKSAAVSRDAFGCSGFGDRAAVAHLIAADFGRVGFAMVRISFDQMVAGYTAACLTLSLNTIAAAPPGFIGTTMHLAIG